MQEKLYTENKTSRSKRSTNAQIDGLNALNSGQTLAEKDLVNQAKTKPAVQEALEKAKELNEAMKALRSEISKKIKLKAKVNTLTLIIISNQRMIVHLIAVHKSSQQLNRQNLIKTQLIEQLKLLPTLKMS